MFKHTAKTKILSLHQIPFHANIKRAFLKYQKETHTQCSILTFASCAAWVMQSS
jgi:hypothetical protein